MSTVAPPAPVTRRSRRMWYLLAIGVVVVVLAVGTIVTLRMHPFGIGGGSGAAAPKQHTTERTTGSDKSASDKTGTDKAGTSDKAATGTRTHEKATPTPGA